MTQDRRGKPVAVRDALRSYLARAGLARRLAQAQVIPEWPRLVGPQIAAVTTPESVTPDGLLFVRVATSAWMTELQLMGPDILAAINGAPGGGGGGGGGAAGGRGGGRITSIRWLLSR